MNKLNDFVEREKAFKLADAAVAKTRPGELVVQNAAYTGNGDDKGLQVKLTYNPRDYNERDRVKLSMYDGNGTRGWNSAHIPMALIADVITALTIASLNVDLLPAGWTVREDKE